MLDLDHLDTLDDDAPPEPDLEQAHRHARRMRTRSRVTALGTCVIVLAVAFGAVVAVQHVRGDNAATTPRAPIGHPTRSGTLHGLAIALTLDTPSVVGGTNIQATVVVRNPTSRTGVMGVTTSLQCALGLTPAVRTAGGRLVAAGPRNENCASLGVGLAPGASQSFAVSVPTGPIQLPAEATEATYFLTLERGPSQRPTWTLGPLPVEVTRIKGLAAQLEIPRFTYRAGGSVDGTIIFVNDSGSPIDYYLDHVGGCATEPPWHVLLAQHGTLFEMGEALPGCLLPAPAARLEPGTTRIPFSVSLSPTGCTDGFASSAASPKCIGFPPHAPPLKPGMYQIVFRSGSEPFHSVHVAALNIQVLAARARRG